MDAENRLVISDYGPNYAATASLTGVPGFRVSADTVEDVWSHLAEALEEFGIDDSSLGQGYVELVREVGDQTVIVRAVMDALCLQRQGNSEYLMGMAEHDPEFIRNATPDSLDEIVVVAAFPEDTFAELAHAMPIGHYAVIATKFEADGPVYSLNASRGTVPTPATRSREVPAHETVGAVFSELGAIARERSAAKVLVHA